MPVKFSEEFKRDAVALVLTDAGNVAEAGLRGYGDLEVGVAGVGA